MKTRMKVLDLIGSPYSLESALIISGFSNVLLSFSKICYVVQAFLVFSRFSCASTWDSTTVSTRFRKLFLPETPLSSGISSAFSTTVCTKFRRLFLLAAPSARPPRLLRGIGCRRARRPRSVRTRRVFWILILVRAPTPLGTGFGAIVRLPSAG